MSDELREVDPSDLYSGNIVVGEIRVREWPDNMPQAGEEVSFAGERWLVTKTRQLTEGGRRTYTAILLSGCVHDIPLNRPCSMCYGMLADEGREGTGLRYVQGTAR